MDSGLQIRFVIVGGGLAGLAAAIALRRAGHRVTLLEAKKEFVELGAGIQLPPNSTKIFRQWNILDTVLQHSSQPHVIHLRSYAGHILSTTDLIPNMEDNFGAPHLVIHRGDLLRVLKEHASALGAELITGAAIHTIDFQAATVYTTDGRQFLGDVVIGADGEHSTCRRALSNGRNEATQTLSGKLACRFSLPSTAVFENPSLSHLVSPAKITAWLGPQTHVVSYNLEARNMFNVVAILPDVAILRDLSSQATSVGPIQVSPMPLVNFFKDWNPELHELLQQQTGDCLAWRLTAHPTMQTILHPAGKFVLIGDAAHAMPPHLAQGAAQGFEDAAYLGSLFSKMADSADIPVALMKFQKERQNRVRAIHERSIVVGTVWGLSLGPEQQERDRAFARGYPSRDPFPNPFSDAKLIEWLYGNDIGEDVRYE